MHYFFVGIDNHVLDYLSEFATFEDYGVLQRKMRLPS